MGFEKSMSAWKTWVFVLKGTFFPSLALILLGAVEYLTGGSFLLRSCFLRRGIMEVVLWGRRLTNKRKTPTGTSNSNELAGKCTPDRQDSEGICGNHLSFLVTDGSSRLRNYNRIRWRLQQNKSQTIHNLIESMTPRGPSRQRHPAYLFFKHRLQLPPTSQTKPFSTPRKSTMFKCVIAAGASSSRL